MRDIAIEFISSLLAFIILGAIGWALGWSITLGWPFSS
jgi:uncharacterized RDD family membrane protein YckC